MPDLPRRLPDGTPEPNIIAEAVRELDAYIRALPTVEIVRWQGVVKLPITLRTETLRPAYLALTGRPYPEDDTTAVEVLGLSFKRAQASDGRGTITIDSIDGVADGDSVTLTGIVVGDRT